MGFHQLYSGNNSWDNYIMRYCVKLAGFSRPHCIARSMFFARTQQLHYCSFKPTLLSMGKKNLVYMPKSHYKTLQTAVVRGIFSDFLFLQAMGFLKGHPVEFPILTLWHQRIVPYLRGNPILVDKKSHHGGCNLSILQILTPWWFLHWENHPKRPSGGFQSQGTLIAGWLIYVDMEKTWKNDLEMDDEQDGGFYQNHMDIKKQQKRCRS